MRASTRLGLILGVALAAGSGRCQADAEAGPVSTGATRDEVLQALGEPCGRSTADPVTMWHQRGGSVEFKEGLMWRVRWEETAPGKDRREMPATKSAAGSTVRRDKASPGDSEAPGDGALDVVALAEQLSSKDRTIRMSAVSTLEARADPLAWSVLVRALDNPDKEVRLAALDAMCRIDPRRGAERIALVAVLHHDGMFRYEALKRLAEMGNADAVEPLIQALGDEMSYNRKAAAKGLGAYPEAALPRLVTMVRDPDPNTRLASVTALRHLGKAAEPPLINALGDADADVRIQAVRALQGMESQRSKAAIRLLLSDKDRRVSDAGAIALRMLGDRRSAERYRQRKWLRDRVGSLAIAGVFALLGVLTAFRSHVLRKLPALSPFTRTMSLASACLCAAAIVALLAVIFLPRADFLLGSILFCGLAFVTCAWMAGLVFRYMRAVESRAGAALALETPREWCDHFLADGLLFLTLALCLGGTGLGYLADGETVMTALTLALVSTFLGLSVANLSQRARVRTALQQPPKPLPDLFDMPERPFGVAVTSMIAAAAGLSLTTWGYWAVTTDLCALSSEGAGFGILFGGIALFLGLPVLLAARNVWLLKESGRRIIIAFSVLCCVGPLVPVAVAALIYLNRPAVRELFAR